MIPAAFRGRFAAIAATIPDALKGRLAAAIASGSAMAIAGVMWSHNEGRVHEPYLDTGGVWTVCEGHTGPDVIPGKRYTDAECDALKAKDLAVAEADVARCVKAPLTPPMRGAMIDFAGNVGGRQFCTSTLVRHVNAGRYAEACLQYQRWKYDNGRELRGLVKRRALEEWVCWQGVPGEVPLPLARPERE